MYTWLWMSLMSGILLGFYDVLTKKALRKVSLLNVLALYTLFSFLIVSFDYKNALKVESFSLILILLKSFIIFISWILGFIALRSLPISVISPFSTLTPVFTIFMGVTILGERFSLLQVAGIIIILISYYFIGKTGKAEIASLFRNKYLYMMVGSTFLSATSALMDKIILKKANTGQVQFWFCFFLTIMYFAALIINNIRKNLELSIRFSWFIPLMSLFLVVSDRIYFEAVNMTASKISIILPLRRISVIVSIIMGGILFKEKNLKRKLVYAFLLLTGVAVIFVFK